MRNHFRNLVRRFKRRAHTDPESKITTLNDKTLNSSDVHYEAKIDATEIASKDAENNPSEEEHPEFGFVLKIKTIDDIIFTLSDVRPEDTIASIKSEIEDEEAIASNEQYLLGVSPTGNTIELPDDSSLQQHGIETGSILSLYSRGCYLVFIRTDTGAMWPIIVNAADTIHEVKAKIREKHGIPEHEQRLIFAGSQLRDDKTILDYDILNELSLRLVLRLRGGGGENHSLNVLIRLPCGGELYVPGVPTETINDLKSIVRAKKGIPTHEQIFLLRGEVLEDFISLKDIIFDNDPYGCGPIRRHCVLDLLTTTENLASKLPAHNIFSSLKRRVLGIGTVLQSEDPKNLWKPSALEKEVAFRAIEAIAKQPVPIHVKSTPVPPRKSETVVVLPPRDTVIGRTETPNEGRAPDTGATTQHGRVDARSRISPAVLSLDRIQADTRENTGSKRGSVSKLSSKESANDRRRWWRRERSSRSLKQVIVCSEPGCAKTFTTWHERNRHMRYHSRPEECPNCSLRFGTKTHLRRHINEIHEARSRFFCHVDVCDYSQREESQSDQEKIFTRKDHLKRHLHLRRDLEMLNMNEG